MVRPSAAGTITPASTGSSFWETVTCVPRLGRMRGTSSSLYSSSGRRRSAHTPVALITFVAATSNSPPVSASRTSTPAARPSRSTSPVTSQRLATTAPKRSASPSTLSTRRTSSVWQS
jgi:hypothetical protein